MDQITASPHRAGHQSKLGILWKSKLPPLVVSISEAAAMIGLSKNTAKQFFEDRDLPILTLGRTRKVIRIKDLERVLEEIAREGTND